MHLYLSECPCIVYMSLFSLNDLRTRCKYQDLFQIMLFRVLLHLGLTAWSKQEFCCFPFSLTLLGCVHTVFLGLKHGKLVSSKQQLFPLLLDNNYAGEGCEMDSLAQFCTLFFNPWASFRRVNMERHLRLSVRMYCKGSKEHLLAVRQESESPTDLCSLFQIRAHTST